MADKLSGGLPEPRKAKEAAGFGEAVKTKSQEPSQEPAGNYWQCPRCRDRVPTLLSEPAKQASQPEEALSHNCPGCSKCGVYMEFVRVNAPPSQEPAGQREQKGTPSQISIAEVKDCIDRFERKYRTGKGPVILSWEDAGILLGQFEAARSSSPSREPQREEVLNTVRLIMRDRGNPHTGTFTDVELCDILLAEISAKGLASAPSRQPDSKPDPLPRSTQR